MAKENGGERPTYNVRARQEPDSEYMMTIGVAWPFRNGDGYVVKLRATPTNWDGTFILVPPQDD